MFFKKNLALARAVQLYKRNTTLPAEQNRHHRYYAAIGLPRLQRREAPQKLTRSFRVLETELAKATELVQGPGVPSEAAVHDALQICKHLAESLTGSFEIKGESQTPDRTPTSNLLTLEENTTRISPPKRKAPIKAQDEIQKKVANTAYRIVTDPKTFITPISLSLYVDTQAILRQPQSFPRVFDMYASKPVPRTGSTPITYSEPDPNSPKAAVPLPVAKQALNAAIEAQDLPLCLNIITTTVATSAFKRAKFLRKALFPCTAFALSPAAAYALGKLYGDNQERLDQQQAIMMGTVGFMTYFTLTAVSAYIAITTSNHQEDRVTWLIGTPLYIRWFREEERAFTDSIAQAWGFQDYLKRGEEEGEDWENLRLWIMERRMVLDKPELMEGME